VSCSASSVPKVVLMGDMEINDKYFRGTFTPPSFTSHLDLPAPPCSAPSRHFDKTSKKHEDFHTKINGNSSILLNSHIQCLVEHFPTTVQHEAWNLLFSTQVQGTDFSSFYYRSASSKYTLLVVRSEDNQIFGGFATEPWRPTKHGKNAFYGNGESFLFRCHDTHTEGGEDADEDNVDVFEWTYDNYFFMWSNQKQIAMGGGGGQFGFVLDEDFAFAESNPCDTFGNPCLTTHNCPFAIAQVELWGFSSLPKNFETKRSKEQNYVLNYESS